MHLCMSLTLNVNRTFVSSQEISIHWPQKFRKSRALIYTYTSTKWASVSRTVLVAFIQQVSMSSEWTHPFEIMEMSQDYHLNHRHHHEYKGNRWIVLLAFRLSSVPSFCYPASVTDHWALIALQLSLFSMDNRSLSTDKWGWVVKSRFKPASINSIQ